jgi:DnaJ-class molecular chaperone
MKKTNQELPKCKMCKGKGRVFSENRTGQCLYCKGKGVRTNKYGVDEIEQ